MPLASWMAERGDIETMAEEDARPVEGILTGASLGAFLWLMAVMAALA